MTKKQTGVSIPISVLDDLDRLGEEWMTDRSSVITRIILDWKRLKTQQGTLPQSLKPNTPLKEAA